MPRENTLPNEITIDDNTIYRVVTETGDSKLVAGSILKTYIGEGTATPFIEVVGTGDDRGLICTEQWSVGKPNDPKESAFGGGDSYPIGTEDTTPDGIPKAGSCWHCDEADTTGLTITNATDITTIMASDTGSTAGLFGGTTAGKYILVGSDYIFGGVKVKIDTLGNAEPDNIVGEYIQISPDWIPAPFMVSDAEYPYTQRANNIATCSSCNEHWRFGFDPRIEGIVWQKATLNINGTDYTKFWGRFRITSDITAEPILEQIKMHSPRFEVNADGTTEYFGLSRPPFTVNIEKTPNADKSPSNGNISLATDFTEASTDNEFRNNANDGFILKSTLPEGIDTSIPLQIIVDWFPTTAGVGDVELEIETLATNGTFVYDGTAVANPNLPVITSLNNQENENQTSLFLVDISSYLPGNILYVSLFRDATTGNLDDTLSGNIKIADYKIIGYQWRP
jgi:hypothetical protein